MGIRWPKNQTKQNQASWPSAESADFFYGTITIGFRLRFASWLMCHTWYVKYFKFCPLQLTISWISGFLDGTISIGFRSRFASWLMCHTWYAKYFKFCPLQLTISWISWFLDGTISIGFRSKFAAWLMCHTWYVKYFKFCHLLSAESADFQLISDTKCGTKIKPQYLTGIQWWWF